MLKLLTYSAILFTGQCYGQPLLQVAKLTANFLSIPIYKGYTKTTDNYSIIVCDRILKLQFRSKIPPISKGGNKEKLLIFKY